jgi:hypothetical protein
LMFAITRHVGHYGEIFDRTLGSLSGYQLARGANALKRDGGQLTAEDG